MTPRVQKPAFEYAAAATAAAFGWSAVCSWRGMVAEPGQYLGPAFVAAVLIALLGATGRSLRLRWYATLAVQLVALLIWFQHRQYGAGPLGGWLPTPRGVAEVIDQVRDGADAINTYAAPVATSYADAPVYLVACAVLILLLIDLIACGLRLPAWAGLPVLVAVTIPISILDDGLPSVVYLSTGLLFAVLLAVLEVDRALTWGPVVDDRSAPVRRTARLPVVTLAAPALLLGATATVLAMIVSLGVPLGDGLFRRDSGSGSGSGGSGRVNLTNPLVDLRRDLVRTDPITLLDVTTDSRDLSYLRLTILDSFTDGAWGPSPRDLGEENRADGELPTPLGVIVSEAGPTSTWSLRTGTNFATSWLPTPSVTRSISIVQGDWRYDPNFLDVASTDDPPRRGVEYELTAYSPAVSAEELARSAPAPISVMRPMTALPPMPPVVQQIAEQVTAGGSTVQAKAALLQDWFRNSGGFSYSLDPAPGDGLEQLARFITIDKVGYCEQFAAAMALMARSIGIPARVVVGLLNPSETVGASYRYTTDDLHAWPEIYFSGAGWIRFEPTPSSRSGAAPGWTRENVEAPAPNPSPSASTNAPTQAPRPSAPVEETPTGAASGGNETVPTAAVVAVGAVLLILVLLLPAMVRAGQRRRRFRPGPEGNIEVENLWHELQATAVDVGAPWPDHRSPRMVAETISSWVGSAQGGTIKQADRTSLDELVSLVEHSRYGDGFAIGSDQSAAAVAAARRWTELIWESVSSSRSRLARLVPRSVLGRRDDLPIGSADQADELETTTRR